MLWGSLNLWQGPGATCEEREGWRAPLPQFQPCLTETAAEKENSTFLPAPPPPTATEPFSGGTGKL